MRGKNVSKRIGMFVGKGKEEKGILPWFLMYSWRTSEGGKMQKKRKGGAKFSKSTSKKEGKGKTCVDPLNILGCHIGKVQFKGGGKGGSEILLFFLMTN